MKSSPQQSELFAVPQVTGDGCKQTLEENSSFAESIAAVRKERGYTIYECAELTRHPSKTMENWSAGHRSPSRQIQEQVLRDLRNPDNPPSAKVRRTAEESHHLIWDKQKGWEVKVTFDLGPKRVGKRHRRRLKTRDLEEAIERKDILIADWRSLGLKLADRRQKRTKGS